MKRIKKTSTTHKANSSEDSSINENSLQSKDSTNIAQIQQTNPESEMSSTVSQNSSAHGFSGNVRSMLTSGTEESSEAQSVIAAENVADFQLLSLNSQSATSTIMNTKSPGSSQNTGRIASSSKSNSPRKLSSGSGRYEKLLLRNSISC